MEYNSFTLHNYKAIPQLSKLTPAQIEAIEVVGRVLPFKTNNYVIDELINWGNIPDDPIFTLTFPRSECYPPPLTIRSNSIGKQADEENY